MTIKDYLIIGLSCALLVCLAVAGWHYLDAVRRDAVISELERQIEAVREEKRPALEEERQADAERERIDALALTHDAQAESRWREATRREAELHAELEARKREIEALQAVPMLEPETLPDCIGELARITDISRLQSAQILTWEAREKVWGEERETLTGRLVNRTEQLAACDRQVATKNRLILLQEREIALTERKADVAIGRKQWWERLVPELQAGVGIAVGPGYVGPVVYVGVGWRF